MPNTLDHDAQGDWLIDYREPSGMLSPLYIIISSKNEEIADSLIASTFRTSTHPFQEQERLSRVRCRNKDGRGVTDWGEWSGSTTVMGGFVDWKMRLRETLDRGYILDPSEQARVQE
ncbi:hypothetical protein CVT25_013875 [Psilocybe cyanescens]|uniref:Uncharacterized protein n=1 Tax=Psilocybe cyanescens TaxID=93625 RepID=A0A409XFW9_PSICY|nr:hypothetical protein CVT25_013875 [Psilocybe cyanescens]